MSTTEYLEKIKTKCQHEIVSHEPILEFVTPVYAQQLRLAISGWRSTISAIDALKIFRRMGLDVESTYHENIIITHWPEELL